MNQYLQKFGTVTGADRNVNRLAQAVGADDAPWARVFDSSVPSLDIPDGVGTIAGTAAGAYIGFKKGHWLLGAIAGASVGRNLPALVMHPEQRRAAARNLVVTGVACAGSLFMKHNRALGFGVGYLAAAIATYYGGLK